MQLMYLMSVILKRGMPMQLRYIVFIILTVVICYSTSYAVSDQDIDRLTTYTTILGRATACGINTKKPVERVGKWIDRTFSPEEKGTYLEIFAIGVSYAAKMQSEGQSPDSCFDVSRTLKGFPWP